MIPYVLREPNSVLVLLFIGNNLHSDYQTLAFRQEDSN